jgi:periplasmic protein TonB
VAEFSPAFPGGMAGLGAFLSKNMQYPRFATSNGVQGRVIVQFVVERDGSIAQAKVLKGIGFGCDEEALRVINKMPKWTPGSNNGQKVRVYFTLPILFQLDN